MAQPIGKLDFNFGIIVSSDRAASGTYQDESGPTIAAWLQSQKFTYAPVVVLPDSQDQLFGTVKSMVQDGIDAIVISGGTGLGPRDVTPQTLAANCDYEITGIGELLRLESLKFSKNAYLSRCGAWMLAGVPIFALPGNPKAVVEQLDILADLLPHCISAAKGQCRHRRRSDD